METIDLTPYVTPEQWAKALDEGEVCGECGGKGRYVRYPTEPNPIEIFCPTCHGKGRTHRLTFDVPLAWPGKDARYEVQNGKLYMICLQVGGMAEAAIETELPIPIGEYAVAEKCDLCAGFGGKEDCWKCNDTYRVLPEHCHVLRNMSATGVQGECGECKGKGFTEDFATGSGTRTVSRHSRCNGAGQLWRARYSTDLEVRNG